MFDVSEIRSHFDLTCAESLLDFPGYVEFPLPPDFLEGRMRAIFDGMRLITEDPASLEYYPWHVFRTDTYGKGYEFETGLTKRSDTEKKFVFHYCENVSWQFEVQERDRSFFSALHDIEEAAISISKALAEHMDRSSDRLRNYSGSMRERMSDVICITRVLRYEDNGGNSDAFAHTDRGKDTIHWGSSHPGLRIFDRNKKAHEVAELDPTRAVIFPGRKYAAIVRGAGGHMGTPHGVRSSRAPQEDRYALVSFIHTVADPNDAEWLRENDDRIKKYERSLVL